MLNTLIEFESHTSTLHQVYALYAYEKIISRSCQTDKNSSIPTVGEKEWTKTVERALVFCM